MQNVIGAKGTKEEEMVGSTRRESWGEQDKTEESGDKRTGKRSHAEGQLFV